MFPRVCAHVWGAVDVLCWCACNIYYFYIRNVYLIYIYRSRIYSLLRSSSEACINITSYFYLLLSPLPKYYCYYEQWSFSHSSFISFISCDNVAIFIIRRRLLEYPRNELTPFFCSFKGTFFMFHWNFCQVLLAIAAYLSFTFKYTERTGKLF